MSIERGYISERKILDGGHVILEKYMGDEIDILNNAKVSFDTGQDELDDHAKGVLNFLMRERHGSPWEAVVFRFDVRAPLFVFREWMRHRVGSFNEHSARYSEIPAEWYTPAPEDIRRQVGKPGAYTFETIEDQALVQSIRDRLDEQCSSAFKLYRDLLDEGVAKEVARNVLPVNMYSRMKWTVNYRALMNFFSLRSSEHAQREIRFYSLAMEDMVEEVMPYAMQLFNDHGKVAP